MWVEKHPTDFVFSNWGTNTDVNLIRSLILPVNFSKIADNNYVEKNMKNNIGIIMHEIKTGKNIENYLFILMAAIVAILSIFTSVPQAIINSVILAVLALIIYREIETERYIKSVERSQEIQFYHNRTDLPPIEERFETAKTEIAISGLQLGNIVLNYLPNLEQKAFEGCNIKLLMLSPVDCKLKKLPWVDKVGTTNTLIGLEKMLYVNIENLKHWLEQMDDTTKSKISVRLHTSLPTSPMLFIDKDTANGSVKVELLLHHISPTKRPSFLVKKSESPELYMRLKESYDYLWNEALDIDKIPSL